MRVTVSSSRLFVPSANLTGLPNDLLVEIGERCGPRTAARLNCVCRGLRDALRAPSLWYRFYRRHIDASSVDASNGGWWQARFALEAKPERCLQRALQRSLQGFYQDLATPPDGRHPVLALVTLGGDADVKQQVAKHVREVTLLSGIPLTEVDVSAVPFTPVLSGALVKNLEVAIPWASAQVDALARSGKHVVGVHDGPADDVDAGLWRRLPKHYHIDVSRETLYLDA